MTRAPATEDTAVEPDATPRARRFSLDLGNRVPRYVAEMIIGLILAALIALALIATVGSVPFIYQGY